MTEANDRIIANAKALYLQWQHGKQTEKMFAPFIVGDRTTPFVTFAVTGWKAAGKP